MGLLHPGVLVRVLPRPSVIASLALVLAGSAVGPRTLLAQHSDDAVQVDTKGLDSLGTEWRGTNPYRGDPKAGAIGKEGYNQNCARCHGLEAISGGFTPDLRHLPLGAEGDARFVYRVQAGANRNGIQVMPKMAQVLSQELLWAIRTYLESVHEE